MSVNISVKDVPDELAQALRERAARNHRSLQGELMAILEQTVRAGNPTGVAPVALPASVAAPSAPRVLRTRVQGWKTVEQLAAERRAQGIVPDPALAHLPRSVDLIRADRDSR